MTKAAISERGHLSIDAILADKATAEVYFPHLRGLVGLPRREAIAAVKYHYDCQAAAVLAVSALVQTGDQEKTPDGTPWKVIAARIRTEKAMERVHSMNPAERAHQARLLELLREYHVEPGPDVMVKVNLIVTGKK